MVRDPDRYSYVADDRVDVRVIDTADPARVRAACAELRGPVAGVFSSSEYHIATAAGVARTLGLPHPDPAAVRACRDKATQRARLCAGGLPGVGFAVARTPAEAVEAAERIGLPVVVKPVTGSGSVATRRCETPAAVEHAACAVLGADPKQLGIPPQDAVLVEEYLLGAEFSVETFDDQVIGVTRKHLGPLPHFVETGHDFPAAVAPEVAATLGEGAIAALRALGLGWGPAHVELRLPATGRPRIIEVNPRLAGGMIPRVVQEATGIDLIGRTVARAAGQPMPCTPLRDGAASIRFLVAETSGCLAAVDGLVEAGRVPGVVEVALTRQPGQTIVLRNSFHDRLGYVIAAGDPTSAAAAATAGVRELRARIVP
jgi:argininosuccinate lyase